jgi:hypothetical protein
MCWKISSPLDYQQKTSINRQIIEVHEPQSLSLGWALVYLMALEQVEQLGGFLQPDGWWSGCCLTAKYS